VLEKELKLEWKQKDEIEQIFKEYEMALADLKRKLQGNQAQMERERLEQQLKMARQARDTHQAVEILGKLRELSTSISEEERDMREQLIEEIEKVLNEGQKQQFRQMLRPGAGGNLPPLDDPKVLFQCLAQVKVEAFQKNQLDDMKKRYDDDVQRRSSMGQNTPPDEEKMLRKRLYDDVMIVLNDEQKGQLKAAHARMGGQGGAGGGTRVDTKNPFQLQFAVMRLNSTNNRLTTQQNEQLERIRKDYREQFRSLQNDPEGRRRMDEQVSEQILSVLTPEQKEAVENMEMPAGRFGGSRRMGGAGDTDGRMRRGGMDRPGGMVAPSDRRGPGAE
jgi:hypothetical protein